MGFDRNRNNGGRRFKPRRNDGGGSRFRKGSGEFRRSQDGEGRIRRGPRRIRDYDQDRRPIKGRRLIRKRP